MALKEPKVEGMCRGCGDCDDIRFLGKLEAVEEVLSVADLFVMPSEKESFGLAALEAMACQVPVISSNAGGLPELNIHGFSGYLSDVGDVDSMTHFALEILDDKNLATFKKNALARASEFELSKILPEYENYYEEVIEKSASLAV
jgi:glycosyltransferase involved in cell wall biosynthesis